LNAGCKITILVADIHAFLDSMKSTWEQLEARTQYYTFIITEMLKSVGADVTRLHFVTGRDYQIKEDFCLDLYKLSALTSTRDTTRAGAEVVKQSDNPKMSSLLYPLLQALDEEYLHVDAQFGGVDQRKIFVLAREFLPKIGYQKRIHLMNPMIGGLTGDKMSSSEENSKIDILDEEKQVQKKINKAHCVEGEVDGNFLIDFSKIVLFPWLGDLGETFIIDRPEKFGGQITYATFEELKSAFEGKKLHPLDLKMGVAAYINRLLEPIRQAAAQKDISGLLENGYS
ncbi:MAG: tyrosine--tRNA ligase, partial [Nanoarchaeota archaeon]|nr:tyrosine--tRNA ligase [Nanoarchaeota archaeon]